MPLRLWQCALLPVTWPGRSWWRLIKVRNDLGVSITFTRSFIGPWIIFDCWPNMQIKCVFVCLHLYAYCMCVSAFSFHYMRFSEYIWKGCSLSACYSFIILHRIVYFTPFAGFQLWWDGVRKCSPVFGLLSLFGGNCQQPAGHWYCATATASRCRGC